MQPVYEDNHYIAFVKPCGISTEPQFEEKVKAFIKVRDQKPGNVYLRATHRLDRAASGIVLFSKTEKGLVRMHELMRQRQVKKTYLALLEGNITPKEGTWEDPILKLEHKASISPIGKDAVLHYHVLKKEKTRSLVEFDLVTGRYHQIRVQAASRGFFVVGDDWYKKNIPTLSIALFHKKMEFIHPIKGTLCIIEVDCPFI